LKLTTTPWGRHGLTLEQRAELREMLPDEYAMSLSGYSRRGPFRATLGSIHLPPSVWGGGNLSTAWSDVSPYAAAIRAIEAAAGDGSDDALVKQLAASLRARGIEPREGAA
jgi:hypothetical protein